MLFKCNYNVKDLQITSTFYSELLKWWSERLREDNDWHYVIWNNRDFRTDDKPFFYKKYYDIGIWEIGDLHFDLNNTESYEQIAKNVKKTNFLEWTSIRHSIPTNLRVLNRSDSSTFNALPSFKILHKCPVLATRSLLTFSILSSTLLRGVEVWKSPTK